MHPDGTRKQRAAAIRERMARGPQMSMIAVDLGRFGVRVNREQEAAIIKLFADHHRVWVDSWILHELDDLVPELRAAKKQAEAERRAREVAEAKGGGK